MKKFFKTVLVLIALLVIVQIGFYFHATTSPQWEYAKRALACKGANYDFRNCVDLPMDSRKDFTNSSWKPFSCINTASSLYNNGHRAGNCNKFMANPGRWGFHEVSADEAVPGDMMLFLRKWDGARHAGVYTMNSLLGPLCANTVVGGIFVHFLPVKPFLAVHAVGFCDVKYYRYTGK
ncbi:MAG: hypothetical protein MJZ41_05585 [Bacteroidaceae bacterium]|nr:hypothetical protein [Bacteroidaceae bacterium]